jgi:hypothetical protein
MRADARTSEEAPSLLPWANLGLSEVDAEIKRIHQLERRAEPLPPVAAAIRELITRFEICHFKAERHIERITQAIGELRMDFAPTAIGAAHPRSGETAWRKDRTGRSRPAQEFIWTLQLWLAEAPYSDLDPRGIPRKLIEQVSGVLGRRDARKTTLVSALVARLLLKADRPPLPPELAPFWEQVEATDICHYTFPDNLQRMIQAIGKLEPVPDFVGCGSCNPERRDLARRHFHALGTWLRGEPGSLEAQLGDRSPVKQWLAACLAKTLKELAGLLEPIPLS